MRRDGARYVFPAGQGLSGGERDSILRAISGLDGLERDRCSPDRSEAVEWAAEMLTSNFKARRRFASEADQKADDGRVFDGFLIALDGRPAAAVTEAVRMIIGNRTDLSRTFVPTATEVASVVESVVTRWASERARLEWLGRLAEEVAAEPERIWTDEERAALAERVARITGKRRVTA